jgi:hypothetical protein
VATGWFPVGGGNLIYLRTETSEISTDIANNRSTVRVKVWMGPRDRNVSGSTDANATMRIYINGNYSDVGVPSTSWFYDYYNYSEDYLGEWSSVVDHDANGSKTINTSASYGTSGWGSATATDSNFVLTNFTFTAGTPPWMSAAAVTGVTGSVNISWGAATSYLSPVTYSYSYRSSSDGGVNYGSWSSESTTTNTYANYTSLTLGLTYQFRVRASNGQDGSSGFRESNTAFLVAGGKRYFGPNPVSDWALTAAQAKRWSGSAWVSVGTLKRWDGNNWVTLS